MNANIVTPLQIKISLYGESGPDLNQGKSLFWELLKNVCFSKSESVREQRQGFRNFDSKIVLNTLMYFPPLIPISFLFWGNIIHDYLHFLREMDNWKHSTSREYLPDEYACIYGVASGKLLYVEWPDISHNVVRPKDKLQRENPWSWIWKLLWLPESSAIRNLWKEQKSSYCVNGHLRFYPLCFVFFI